MSEFEVRIKLLNSQGTDDSFLDEFIEKIESLDLFYGGSYDPVKGLLKRVLDFTDFDDESIESKTYSLQHWLAFHPKTPVLLHWKLYEPDE